jgi:hypothetical protein
MISMISSKVLPLWYRAVTALPISRFFVNTNFNFAKLSPVFQPFRVLFRQLELCNHALQGPATYDMLIEIVFST